MELNKEDTFKSIVREYSSNSFEVAEKMCLEFLKKYPEEIRVLNILGALFVQKDIFQPYSNQIVKGIGGVLEPVVQILMAWQERPHRVDGLVCVLVVICIHLTITLGLTHKVIPIAQGIQKLMSLEEILPLIP